MGDKNGGNPRLDRIERILDGLTKRHAESDARQERRWAESDAQQKRRWAESDARSERWKAEMAANHARHDREMRVIRTDLRRWAALGVKEARNQRKRHRVIDEYITRLTAAQLVTEEKLKNLLSSMGNGQNGGRHKSA